MKTILFVCTANICRSPLAAALLRKRIADLGLAAEVTVESAGVWAREGLAVSAGSAAALAARGISLEDHRSQPMNTKLLTEAALVLTMEEEHRKSLFYLEPRQLHKVFLLTEMVGRSADIADPYGGPNEGYVKTANELDALITAGLPEILKRVGITSMPQQIPVRHESVVEPQ